MKKIHINKITSLIIFIFINLVGKYIAHRFSLPVFLDSTGTFLACYFLGPLWGVVAAVPSNIIWAALDPVYYLYAAISLIDAVILGIMFRSGYIKGLISMMNSGMLAAAVNSIILPFFIFFIKIFDIPNIWGDGLRDMLVFYGYGDFFSIFPAIAIIELIDKQVCAFLAYYIIVLSGNRRYKKPEWSISNKIKSRNEEKKKSDISAILSILMCLILSAVTIMIPLNAEAKDDSVSFIASVYDGNSGMLSTEGNCIYQADDGYLWIGSNAGLIYYDGNKFYREGISGQYSVNCILSDNNGGLWLGTNNNGVVRYTKDSVQKNYDTVDGLPSDTVRALCYDDNNNLYIATSEGLCYLKEDGTISKKLDNSAYITSMAEYNGAIICVSSLGELFAFRNGRRIDYYQEEEERVFYNTVNVTSDGVYAGSTGNGILKIKVSERYIYIGENIDVPKTNITNIFEDSRGFLWVCADDGCGYLFNGVFHDETVTSFSSFSDIIEDFQGNIWISSPKNGVLRLAVSNLQDVYKECAVASVSANAVYKTGQLLYVGTDNGLLLLDLEKEDCLSTELTEMVAEVNVQSVYQSKDGYIWVGTYSDITGLIRYDETSGEIVKYTTENGLRSGRIRCIDELTDGTLVIGTQGGLSFIKDGIVLNTLTEQDGLKNAQVQSLMIKDNDEIYVGTDGDGIYIIKDYSVKRHYTTQSGLGSDVIFSAASYGSGAIVVTSNSIDFISSNSIRRIDFPCENNYEIMIRGTSAYVTCSAGLYIVDTKEMMKNDLSNYRLLAISERIGTSPVIYAQNYLDENGDFYFCCNNKVLKLDDSVNIDETGCIYDIYGIKINNLVIHANKETGIYSIPADARQITIVPSIRNYSINAPKVKFYIKEFGDSSDPIYFDEIEPIIVSNLSYGEYHVVMEIYDGEDGTFLSSSTYVIYKKARIWEHVWFKLYIIFATFEIALYGAYLLFRIRNNIIKKNELVKQQEILERKVDEQTANLILEREHTKKLFNQTIMALSNSVDAKDRYTSGHSKRVADYSVMLAARMGKTPLELESVYRAGLLHDIGKIRVPSAVINKNGKLTDEEYEIIKMHPVTGYYILKSISDDKNIMEGARFHHERYDGLGYPNGLLGTDIPEIARIIGVADAYDAMTSNRSYRKVMKQEDVKEEIKKGIGKQFDPGIARLMLNIIDEDVNYEYHEKNMADVKNILLIDEDVECFNNIVDILKNEPKYKVKQAKTKNKAIEMLNHETPDLIIIDSSISDANAFELAEWLRKKYVYIPVVFTMDNRDTQIIRKILESGIQDYMTKPITKEILKEIVHTLIDPY